MFLCMVAVKWSNGGQNCSQVRMPNNVGAILVIGRGLRTVHKFIHPIPPALQSPETSPERLQHDTWMQVNLF